MITFASKQRNMTVREWIKERSITGLPTFSYEELRRSFVNQAEQITKNDLFRLSSQKIILPVYKGFYVIIPPQYAAKGIIPPTYYISQLMDFLGKPYYISLLSAAELLGAAHQRPQRFSVTTIFPKSSVSMAKNNLLAWNYRKEIPRDLLLSKNSETSAIFYSNAELTAIDIVQYEQYIGGLSRAATILDELVEQTNFSKTSDKLFSVTTLATIQRLGYILEEVLQQTEQAETLYEQLCSYAGRFRYVPLSTRHNITKIEKNTRWKINVNITIETDEI